MNNNNKKGEESQLQNSITENESKQYKKTKNLSPTKELSEEQKQNNMEQFQRFLKQTGISDAFQVIFAEIIDKKIKEEDSYQYVANRLREIGKGLSVELTRGKQEAQKKELQEKMKKK